MKITIGPAFASVLTRNTFESPDSNIDMGRIADNSRYPARGSVCRCGSKRRKSVSFLAVVVLGVLVVNVGFLASRPLMASEEQGQWQPIEEIAATAEGHILDRYGTSDANLTPEAGYLDPRLKLANCSQALEAYMQDGASLNSRTVVGVRCDGDKPWKIFVPVRVAITDTVVVATRSLPSGHSLTIEDISTEQRDVSRQTGGYSSDPSELIGKQLKRSLMPGRLITPSMLTGQIMIERGQSVTITARSGGINIETAGKALMDGTLNERIRVENAASNRVIEAIVRSPEHVEVLVN